MILKFKKLSDNAVLPSYAKEGDAGLDLTVTESREDTLNHVVKVKFGISVEIPVGHVGLIFPRSSIYKKGLYLSNSVGVIDSGYRGELMANFYDFGVEDTYEVGERCAQMIIVPYPIIESEWSESLSSTERGSGGFGSTGS